MGEEFTMRDIVRFQQGGWYYKYQGYYKEKYNYQMFEKESSMPGMLSNNYESCLVVPQAFTNISLQPERQDKGPDKAQNQSNKGQCPVSPKFISIFNSITSNSPPTQDNTEVCDGIITMTNESSEILTKEDFPSDEESTELSSNTVAKRPKDDKNGPKKMITFLNQSISNKDKRILKKQLKRLNKIQKLDPSKGSRYGFTCSLLNIREILGEDILLQVFETYNERLKGFPEPGQTQDQKLLYLISLKPSEFINGYLNSSVEWTYDMDDFKQKKYKKQGIAYVYNYEKKLKRLLAGP